MSASASDLIPVIQDMLKHPPDPNAPPEPFNRRETIYGVTLPFLILSLVAVGIRLQTRLRIVCDPGLDDVFVVLAAIMNLIVHASFYRGTYEGYGHHIIFLLPRIERLLVWFYVSNGTYTTTTILIKLSLVFQFMRYFRAGYRRILTKLLMVLITIWGCLFLFMMWFPCFPVSAFWNKISHPQPSAKCYALGSRRLSVVQNTILAFAGSNMVLDIAILLLPITEFFRPGLKRQQLLAMSSLFAIASIAVTMAMLRLWSGFKNDQATKRLDFTFWWNEFLMFSCLEIDFAIMSASIPIFWPSVKAVWSNIFVTREVTVVHGRSSRYNNHTGTYPLELELVRPESIKSHGSTEGLTHTGFVEDKPGSMTLVPAAAAGVSQVEVTSKA